MLLMIRKQKFDAERAERPQPKHSGLPLLMTPNVRYWHRLTFNAQN
jgi:hypothetical protein